MTMTAAERAAAQERLADLREARDSGATEVRYRDRTVRYRTLDDINQLIDRLSNELADKPRQRQPRSYVGFSSKGVG